MNTSIVYGGPQYQNIKFLDKSIIETIFRINSDKRQSISDLYEHIIQRWIHILGENYKLI